MRWTKLLTACCAAIPLAGCLPVKLENARELMQHPEFPAAIVCPHCGNAPAPHFTRSALRVINSLEAELESKP